MPNPVFDGLPDIFTEALGEPVDYTPGGGVTKRIQAIWWESSLDIPDAMAAADANRTTLSVRACDVTPAEDDVAVRVCDGKVMVVSTPILPDGKGVIVCNLIDC